MNVGKAKELFSQYGEDFVSELEHVANVFRTAHVRLPLSNGNFLHALCLTRVMMRHTVSSFKMVTGGAGGQFIGCLKSDFSKMLGRLEESGGAAQILVLNGGAEEDDTLAQLAAEFPRSLKVAYATSDVAVRHYIVADNDMLRDEKEHPPLNDDSDADSVVADVYFRNANMASLFADRFRRQWHSATIPA